jgi:hypothetical protein
LNFKESFKKSEFYQDGYVFYNKKKPKSSDEKSKLNDFKNSLKNVLKPL